MCSRSASLWWLAVPAFFLGGAAARADPTTTEPQARGVVIEPRIGLSGQVYLAQAGPERLPVTLQSSSTSGQIFAGYKLHGWMFGLGLQLGYDQASSTGGGGGGDPFTGAAGGTRYSASVTSLGVMPGLRVALARSRSGKVELYGQVDIGYQRQLRSSMRVEEETGLPRPPNGTFVATATDPWALPLDVGLGLRYWADPQLALGVATLLAASWSTSEYTSVYYDSNGVPGSPSITSSSSFALSLGGALVATGVL